ncbi:MAG: WecB/TagA/CpsF family glycosyltransferase [Sedimentisphaerales bacterium]|nr:WecB/TagA/CpsF family glycosyltransferase [Sedimentisphaerales bacterium]
MIQSTELRRIDLFGVPVTALESYRYAEDRIVERIKSHIKTFCVAVNPEKIYRSQRDNELMRLINSADFHLCDGIGALVAAHLLSNQKIGRVTGVQLFLNLMARAEKEGLKVFLLGAKPEVNEGAFLKLKQKHPRLQIVGRQDGYFKDDSEVVRIINKSGADMLFVAMGSPCQEKWINRHRSQINAPYCMGVGGTFDVVSGFVKWAPKIFRATGTEWFYRLCTEPKRFKRQLVLPKFALMVLFAKLTGRRRKIQAHVQ